MLDTRAPTYAILGQAEPLIPHQSGQERLRAIIAQHLSLRGDGYYCPTGHNTVQGGGRRIFR